MAKWIVFVETACADPAREDEFNEWYNKVHLPDVLETEGIFRAVRYQNLAPNEGQAKYLAAYEVDADDLSAAMQASNENLARKAAEGRISELMQVVSVKSYVQLYSVSG